MKNNTHLYDISVVIGRFSPAHFAHIGLFTEALNLSDNLIIILGSHESPRNIDNPWNALEREQMIRASLPADVQDRIHFGYVINTLYSDADWVASVSSTVRQISTKIGYGQDYLPRIALVTHEKDETTYYINYFKSWKIIDIGRSNANGHTGPVLSATKVRELYFEEYFNLLPAICPQGVVDYLLAFAKTEHFAALQTEYREGIKYENLYENIPFGQVNFVTVDNVVIQSGHVLLVQRKKAPGKGLWALPGGHLNVNENFLTGALRELREETQIKVPDKVLRGSVFHDEIFDHPNRSSRCRIKTKRGRTITRAYGYKLDDAADLPHVVAADDAEKAWWFTFEEVQRMRNVIFEDHFDIIMKFLNKL